MSHIGRKVRVLTDGGFNNNLCAPRESGVITGTFNNGYRVELDSGKGKWNFFEEEVELIEETSTEMKNENILQRIEELQKELDKLRNSIKVVEEPWIPKVGDWVTTTTDYKESVFNQTEKSTGYTFQIQECYNDDTDVWYRPTKDRCTGVMITDIRKATEEEIKQATQLQPVYKIGDYVYRIGKGDVKKVVGIQERDGWWVLEGEYLSYDSSRYNYYNPDPMHIRKATQEEIDAQLKKWKPGDKFMVIQPHLIITGKVITAKSPSRSPYDFIDDEDGNNWIIGSQVRPATEEEIKAAETYTMTIGESALEVRISKNKIEVLVGGMWTTGEVSDLENTITHAKQIAEKCSIKGWSVRVSEVTVGCQEGIKISELEEIIKQYKRINS